MTKRQKNYWRQKKSKICCPEIDQTNRRIRNCGEVVRQEALRWQCVAGEAARKWAIRGQSCGHAARQEKIDTDVDWEQKLLQVRVCRQLPFKSFASKAQKPQGQKRFSRGECAWTFVASDAFCELDVFGACIRNMMYINQVNQVHDVNRVHQIHHSHKGGTRHIRDPEVEFCSDKIKLTESLFW